MCRDHLAHHSADPAAEHDLSRHSHLTENQNAESNFRNDWGTIRHRLLCYRLAHDRIFLHWAAEFPMSHHTIRFLRHTVTGEHRAVCTCGWSMTGDLETVQTVASVHDLRMMPEETEIVPFQSGLSTD